MLTISNKKIGLVNTELGWITLTYTFLDFYFNVSLKNNLLGVLLCVGPFAAKTCLYIAMTPTGVYLNKKIGTY